MASRELTPRILLDQMINLHRIRCAFLGTDSVCFCVLEIGAPLQAQFESTACVACHRTAGWQRVLRARTAQPMRLCLTPSSNPRNGMLRGIEGQNSKQHDDSACHGVWSLDSSFGLKLSSGQVCNPLRCFDLIVGQQQKVGASLESLLFVRT